MLEIWKAEAAEPTGEMTHIYHEGFCGMGVEESSVESVLMREQR